MTPEIVRIQTKNKKPGRAKHIMQRGFIAGGAGSILLASAGLFMYTRDRIDTQLTAPPQSAELNLGLTHESVSNLLTNVKRIETTVPTFYRQYGYNGGDCIGFVAIDPVGNSSILTAQHCAPEVFNDTAGRPTSTRTTDGKSFLKIQALTNSTDSHSPLVDLSIQRYFSSGLRPVIDSFDVISLYKPDVFSENLGISIPKDTKLPDSGDRLTFLSLDSKGNPVSGSLYFIGLTNGDLTMLAFDNLDETCILGQSGSPIVDKNGQLRGIFTDTQITPTVLTTQSTKAFNLPESFVGKTAKICLGVGLPSISNLLQTN